MTLLTPKLAYYDIKTRLNNINHFPEDQGRKQYICFEKTVACFFFSNHIVNQ